MITIQALIDSVTRTKIDFQFTNPTSDSAPRSKISTLYTIKPDLNLGLALPIFKTVKPDLKRVATVRGNVVLQNSGTCVHWGV